jgi:hypothetical protein
MKKCSYCGRENDKEANHCKECGTPFPEEPKPADMEAAPQAVLAEPVKVVASLGNEQARDLAHRLQQAEITGVVRVRPDEIGLNLSEVVVEAHHYEQACDVAEMWDEARSKELEKEAENSRCWSCPNCGSKRRLPLPRDLALKVGQGYQCKDCGATVIS